MQNGKCINCGGAMSFDTSLLLAVCKYCGSEILIESAVQKIQIDGIVSFDILLLSAEQSIALDGDYDAARKQYKQALMLNPNDFRVLWGLFLCEIQSIRYYSLKKGFVQFPGDIPGQMHEARARYGARACMYAPKETREYYLSVDPSLRNYI